jgi:lysophospholipase L1-like esterase
MTVRVRNALLAALVACTTLLVGAAAVHDGRTTDEAARIASAAAPLPPPAPRAGDYIPPPVAHPVVGTHGRAKPLVVIVGDSYAGGGNIAPAPSYAKRLAAKLGWDVRVLSCPGGGYVSPGTSDCGPLPRLLGGASLDRLQPDLVILQAGLNDRDRDPDMVGTGMYRSFTAVRAAAPDAQVAVVGMFWPMQADRDRKTYDIADAIADAAGKLGAAVVMNPLREGWSDFHTTDDRHPDVAGHELIASRIIDHLRSAGVTTT